MCAESSYTVKYQIIFRDKVTVSIFGYSSDTGYSFNLNTKSTNTALQHRRT